jgi:protein-disulfide isomerase
MRVPAHATSAGDGVVVGAGRVPVDAYVDFQCPYCRRFEARCGALLRRLLDAGAISLVYHPMNFLDRLSTTRYSTRAAAASGCAADGGRFYEYARALFAFQPPEGGPGLSDDELVALGVRAGLDERFEECLRAGIYLAWPDVVTARAAERGVSGTPTVFVDGTPTPPDPAPIEAAVAQLIAP